MLVLKPNEIELGITTVSKPNQVDPIWTGYFSSHYGSSFTEQETDRALNFQWGQLKAIAKYANMQISEKVLEIGCAGGGFIKHMQDSGVSDIYAIELDEEAARYTQSTRSVPVSNLKISEYSDTDNFDKIYAFEVLEHLDNPQADLAKIFELLKPGGQFIASTPYPFKRSITSDKTHVSVLHPLNWKRLLNQTGFDVELLQAASGIPFLYRFSEHLSIYLPIYVPFLPVVSTTLIVARKKSS